MDSDLAFIAPRTRASGTVPGSIVVSVGVDAAVISLGLSDSGDEMFMSGDMDFEAPGAPVVMGLEHEREPFSEDKRFFETLTSTELNRYRGSYVAVHGRRIVDSDPDLYALTNRFFSAHGDVPVYIAFIGRKRKHFFPGPMFLGR